MDKPSPEENVECRPGKDTVCGVCGETLRWIERKFPELSGWEECRFHLAAPEMFDTLKAIAAGRYTEGEEQGMAQAAIAKLAGHDHQVITTDEVDSSFTWHPPVQDIDSLPKDAKDHDASWVESEWEAYVYSATRGAWETLKDHVEADRAEAQAKAMDRFHRERALAMAPIGEEDRKRIMDQAQKHIARWVDLEIAALCPEPCVCGRMPAVRTREDKQITLSCCDLEVARPTVGRCAADRVTLEMINTWNVLVRTASREEVARLRSRVRELEELLGTAGAT